MPYEWLKFAALGFSAQAGEKQGRFSTLYRGASPARFIPVTCAGLAFRLLGLSFQFPFWLNCGLWILATRLGLARPPAQLLGQSIRGRRRFLACIHAGLPFQGIRKAKLSEEGFRIYNESHDAQQLKLLRITNNTSRVIAKNSEHFIADSEPELVLGEIEKLYSQIRKAH